MSADDSDVSTAEKILGQPPDAEVFRELLEQLLPNPELDVLLSDGRPFQKFNRQRGDQSRSHRLTAIFEDSRLKAALWQAFNQDDERREKARELRKQIEEKKDKQLHCLIELELVKPIGDGANATVYEAKCQRTDKRFAVKIFKQRLINEDSLTFIVPEAQLNVRVDNPHVVEVIAIGADQLTSKLWIIMEYLDGKTLKEEIKEHSNGLEHNTIHTIMHQLCTGINALHENDIVHRDLTHKNIFLADQKIPGAPASIVKILDFGLAKLLNKSGRASHTGPRGTPGWKAWEQHDETDRISPQTDICAIGFIAYYMFTGKKYLAVNGEDTDPKPPVFMPASQRAREQGVLKPLPEGFDDWFSKCSAIEPASRYRSALIAYAQFKELVMKGVEVDNAAIHTAPIIALSQSSTKPEIFKIAWIVPIFIAICITLLFGFSAHQYIYAKKSDKSPILQENKLEAPLPNRDGDIVWHIDSYPQKMKITAYSATTSKIEELGETPKFIKRRYGIENETLTLSDPTYIYQSRDITISHMGNAQIFVTFEQQIYPDKRKR